MPKKRLVAGHAHPKGMPIPKEGSLSLYGELQTLLDGLQTPPPSSNDALLAGGDSKVGRRRPGRPSRQRADTVPVIMHLYKSQVQWLDRYAGVIAAMRPDNVHLSRVEIVRGLLLGLAGFAVERDMNFPSDIPVTDERSFQLAITESLRRSDKNRGSTRG